MNIEHMKQLCHFSRNFSVVVEGLTKRIKNLEEHPFKNRNEIRERLIEMEQLTKKFEEFIVGFKIACDLDELNDE